MAIGLLCQPLPGLSNRSPLKSIGTQEFGSKPKISDVGYPSIERSSETKTDTHITTRNISGGKSNASIIAVESNTGRILSQQDARKMRHPASLTKLMTLYIMFESLDHGRIHLRDRICFSPRASTEPKMKLGVSVGDCITTEEAILSLIVLSANDTATAVGERLGGGNLSRFVNLMNQKAQELKMHDTVFKNAHGLHNSEQVTTVRDIAKLAIQLRMHFPHYYSYFSKDKFQFRGKTVYGHNRITSKYKEVDGLKTGYISASGYNLATSVTKDGFGLVAVIIGSSSSAARDSLMDDLINSITEERTGHGLTPTTALNVKKAYHAKQKISHNHLSNRPVAKPTAAIIAAHHPIPIRASNRIVKPTNRKYQARAIFAKGAA